MKKITFIFSLLTISLGFSQNLLTNGDFETGSAAPWTGNGAGANVVDDGSTTNFVNAALVGAAAEGWQTNLQQVLTLTQAQTYQLTYDAYVDSGTASMLVGVAENFGGFSGGDTTTPNLTTVSQSFSHNLTFNNATTANGRVFFDMGGTANSGKTIFIDNVSLVVVVNTCANGIQDGDETGVDCGGSCPNACPVPPNVPAPTPPARAASDVVNVYSGAYANSQALVATNFDVPSNTSTWSEQSISGDNYWAISHSGNDFVGFNFESNVDASAMTRFHMDYWTTGTPPGGVINFKLSQHDAGFLTGETDAAIHLINPPGPDGQWNSVDVEIPADFNVGVVNEGMTVRNFLSQMVVSASGAGGAFFDNIYFDNVYFHNGAVLSVNDFKIEGLRVFPNPSNSNWTIKTKAINMSSIKLYDILGKNILSINPNADEASIDGSSFKAGLYFAQIATENGTSSIKLIKQ